VTARGGESGSLLRTLYPALVRQSLYEALPVTKCRLRGWF
jgi:hypothetical protein